MARARSLKPGLFKNEILGVADPLYTLAFEGLWLLADREGRLEDRPMRIKAEIFPYRNVDMTLTLDWLQDEQFIKRYEVFGKRYIQIINFCKHQNPHKNEAESEIPGMACDCVPINSEGGPNKSEALGLTPLTLSTDSLNPSENLSTSELAAPVTDRCPPCPIKRIVEIYHEELPFLTRCVVMNSTREGYLRQRWRECFDDHDFATTEEGLEQFRAYFQHVAKSDFLCGKTRPNGDRKPFLADLEWLVRPTNWAKVIEGKYHPDGGRHGAQTH